MSTKKQIAPPSPSPVIDYSLGYDVKEGPRGNQKRVHVITLTYGEVQTKRRTPVPEGQKYLDFQTVAKSLNRAFNEMARVIREETKNPQSKNSQAVRGVGA